MRKIKHYTERVPKMVKDSLNRNLGIKLGLFATYSDILDKLYERGYWIELQPFYTFAFKDRVGFLLKVWKCSDENTRWNCIYDEETMYESGSALGGSFWYAIRLAVLKIKRDINNE